MLVDFTVGNFLSFHERKTLSMKAEGISELKQNLVSLQKQKLLRSAVVYGPNSSGKSNLLKALGRMRQCVLESVRLNDGDPLPHTPFLLEETSAAEPTFFEVVFWLDEEARRFRYGFEYDADAIVNEWLFEGRGPRSETALFVRTPEGIGVSDKFGEGIGKEGATNANRLFISLVAQLGGSLSKRLVAWFRRFNVISGLRHESHQEASLKAFTSQGEFHDKAQELLKSLRLGFESLEIVEKEGGASGFPYTFPITFQASALSWKTVHHQYDKNGNRVGQVLLDLHENESEGTRKIIDLLGPIIDTLLHGRLLVVDELDSKLHPLITRQVIRLFHDPRSNPKGAQLLLSTHDTNLLSEALFRRDQIWFTEKDEREQTDLFSLYDITLPDQSRVRSDANYERNYLHGRYGAIPFLFD